MEYIQITKKDNKIDSEILLEARELGISVNPEIRSIDTVFNRISIIFEIRVGYDRPKDYAVSLNLLKKSYIHVDNIASQILTYMTDNFLHDYTQSILAGSWL